MSQRVNNQKYYFGIDDNKILKAGLRFAQMEEVNKDGSCPELGKKFTLDTTNWEVKMEDLQEAINEEDNEKKEFIIKEITQDGYILYHSSNSILTKKEFYVNDKLMKIEFSYPQ